MTTLEYLGQLKNIDIRIKNKISDAEKWWDIAYGGTGSSSEDRADRVQTSKRYDKMGDAIAIAIDAENECREYARDLALKKYTIEKQIDTMPNIEHYKVLHGIYIDKQKLSKVAKEIGYSRSSTYDLFNEAIEAFGIIYAEFIGD